jgi:hypothetical protein
MKEPKKRIRSRSHEMTTWEGNPTSDEEESKEGRSTGLSDAEP